MSQYQVGGSLNVNDCTYVMRAADTQLYGALSKSNFCYVFNCRQMGKSSLRVRVKNLLESQGYACVSLDMTNVGSKTISASQWYKSIAAELWRGFDLMEKVKFKVWWSKHSELSSIQKLNRFITDVILTTVAAEKIFILIDEIDSVISLDFPTDDFFALIRYFYNARAENDHFQRLSFALFGVATPNELISDRTRTPFNIGTAIELTGFDLEAAMPLVAELEHMFKDCRQILQEILNWTGGQPFLTQKLCKLIFERSQQTKSCPLPGEESTWLQKLVREKILDNWEAQDEPEHLRTIRDRLLRNEQQASLLLGLSEKIFRQGFIAVDDSVEQRELLLSNLVVKKSGQLVPRNLIYQRIFNLNWIEQQQSKLNPFAKEVHFWQASAGKDKSRLLRGQALQEAQAWANIHNISQLEYQFLTASQEQEQEGIRQNLELDRLKEIESRLFQEQTLAKTQRFLLSTIGGALLITAVLGINLFQKYRQATVNEIKALSSSSQALFVSEQKFDALIAAIKANQIIKSSAHFSDRQTASVAESSLRQAVYGISEYNRLEGNIGVVFSVAISSQADLIATGGEDTVVRLWQGDGTLLHILKGHQARIWDIKFSPDGKTIATASRDHTVKLWNLQGQELRTFKAHSDSVLGVAFSTDGKTIATASRDRTVKLWNLQGKLLHSIAAHTQEIHDLTFSPDGKILVTIGNDRKIKFWQLSNSSPTIKHSINTVDDLRSVAFSPNGQLVAVGSQNGTIIFLKPNGKIKSIIPGHDNTVSDLAFTARGERVISTSWDQTTKVWHPDGSLSQTLTDTSQRIWGVAVSADNQTVATAAERNGVKLWRPRNPLLVRFRKHKAAIIDVVYHPNQDIIATASDDKTIELTNSKGRSLATWQGEQNGVLGIDYSPDGKYLVSGHNDGMIKLWKIAQAEPTKFTKVTEILEHQALVWRVAFSPDGKLFATASEDNTVKIWSRQGELLHTLHHSDGVRSLAFSPDGKLLASGSLDETIKVWSRQGKLLATLAGHRSAVVTVNFSPTVDRQTYTLGSGSWDTSAKLWRIKHLGNRVTGTVKTELLGHSETVRGISFSPDGQLVATASSDRSVKLWQRNGEPFKTLFGHDAALWQVNFSPQGDKIVSVSEDFTAIVWDLARINNLNLLSYGCSWIADYLKTNPKVEERNLCN